jgi:hypothetical protein
MARPTPEEDVREIAASPDALKGTLAEAAATAMAQLKASGPGGGVATPPPPPPVSRRRRVGPLVLVYLLGIVSGAGVERFRRAPEVPPPDPLQLIAILSPAAAAAASAAPEWSAYAGGDLLSERGRAIRLGGLLVEFERAAARGDSAAQVFAEAISAIVVEIPDGTDVATLYAAGGDRARSSSTRRALYSFARAAPLALGAWIQAARVAAAAGDAGFFASRKSREELAYLLRLPGITPEASAARDRLETLLTRRGLPDFGAVSGALEVVQRELAN